MYTWDMRYQVIDRLLAVEDTHEGALTIESDIFPLEAVKTMGFAKV